MRRNKIAFGKVGVDQPQQIRKCRTNTNNPYGRDGPLQSAVGELGLVLEWMNNGYIALQTYQDKVAKAHIARYQYDRPEDRRDHVVAARVVVHVNNDDVRRVPQYKDAGHEVGYQHAGQNEVSLGPEYGSILKLTCQRAVQNRYGHKHIVPIFAFIVPRRTSAFWVLVQSRGVSQIVINVKPLPPKMSTFRVR